MNNPYMADWRPPRLYSCHNKAQSYLWWALWGEPRRGQLLHIRKRGTDWEEWRIWWAMNSQLVTSVLAPKQRPQREVDVCFLKPARPRQWRCLTVCHIVATPTTSAQKAADCQQKLPGLVIDFRGEKTKWGRVVEWWLLIWSGNMSMWSSDCHFLH